MKNETLIEKAARFLRAYIADLDSEADVCEDAERRGQMGSYIDEIQQVSDALDCLAAPFPPPPPIDQEEIAF